jgi:hypothetical protein
MNKAAALEHILQEIGNEVRSRREPEHAFTAAAVGALGAIAAGTAAVATIPALATVPAWRHPAIVGAFACVLIAIAILIKIERENRVYREARAEQIRLYAAFAAEYGLDNGELPKGLQSTATVRKGHWFSAAIVLVAALGSSGFCVAVWRSGLAVAPAHLESDAQPPNSTGAPDVARGPIVPPPRQPPAPPTVPSPSSTPVQSPAPGAPK